MKTVLVAIVIQAVSLPATETEPAATATAILSTPITAEYDDMAACAFGAKGIAVAVGDRLIRLQFTCRPKGLAKLEVEKPKEKQHQLEKPKEVEHGTRS
jgi:hypothetical protein